MNLSGFTLLRRKPRLRQKKEKALCGNVKEYKEYLREVMGEKAKNVPAV
jgi:hypothetical protein